MKLFIDTADVTQIRTAWDWGIIDGVTTNPSHVSKTGRKALDVYREILEIVDGPVSLETVTLTAPEIVEEGICGFCADTAEKLPQAITRCFTLDRSRIRERAAKQFSAQRMAQDYAEAYEQIIARRK